MRLCNQCDIPLPDWEKNEDYCDKCLEADPRRYNLRRSMRGTPDTAGPPMLAMLCVLGLAMVLKIVVMFARGH